MKAKHSKNQTANSDEPGFGEKTEMPPPMVREKIDGDREHIVG